jgi:hypothetical protein
MDGHSTLAHFQIAQDTCIRPLTHVSLSKM